MKAYKFLAQGGRGRFSDFAWPLPTPNGLGPWVETADDLEDCRNGIHACAFRQLLDWIDDELWEIELGGEVVERETMLVAQRGRLLARVDAWDDAAAKEFADACAWRARDYACRALRRVGLTEEAERLLRAVELEEIQSAAAEAAERSDRSAAELTGFAADAVSLAEGQRPETWNLAEHPGGRAPVQTRGAVAANLAFVVAHAAGREAAAMGGEDDYAVGVAAERAWQLGWLAERLDLRVFD